MQGEERIYTVLISCTAWPGPYDGVSILQNWKQLRCSITTASVNTVLWRLSTLEVGRKSQMYLSINARPGAAQKTLLLFTVQLFLTTTRGQSLLPDEKSCESSR